MVERISEQAGKCWDLSAKLPSLSSKAEQNAGGRAKVSKYKPPKMRNWPGR